MDSDMVNDGRSGEEDKSNGALAPKDTNNIDIVAAISRKIAEFHLLEESAPESILQGANDLVKLVTMDHPELLDDIQGVYAFANGKCMDEDSCQQALEHLLLFAPNLSKLNLDVKQLQYMTRALNSAGIRLDVNQVALFIGLFLHYEYASLLKVDESNLDAALKASAESCFTAMSNQFPTPTGEINKGPISIATQPLLAFLETLVSTLKNVIGLAEHSADDLRDAFDTIGGQAPVSVSEAIEVLKRSFDTDAVGNAWSQLYRSMLLRLSADHLEVNALLEGIVSDLEELIEGLNEES